MDIAERTGTENFTISRQKITVAFLGLALALSVFLNFYLSANLRVQDSPTTGFSFLDPGISSMSINDYLKTKDGYTASYCKLKSNVSQIINNASGNFGVYFEDLTFHSWFGIDEREAFMPASLLKITTVASVLKEVEEGGMSLDTEVTLTKDDLDYTFGTLYEHEGQNYTIKRLIEIALINSDNTAAKKLYSYLTEERWREARLAMGLPMVSVQESYNRTPLTPKQFSSVFRSLYYSGYLSRTFSNWVLMLLSETEFNDGIPAGLPAGTVVSHKIGVWPDQGSVHDCGIVYAKKPYILCVMSDNTTTQEGNRVIKEISKTVYDYISNS